MVSTSGQATGSVCLSLVGKMTDFLSTYILVMPLQYVVMAYFSSSMAYVNGAQVVWYWKYQVIQNPSADNLPTDRFLNNEPIIKRIEPPDHFIDDSNTAGSSTTAPDNKQPAEPACTDLLENRTDTEEQPLMGENNASYINSRNYHIFHNCLRLFLICSIVLILIVFATALLLNIPGDLHFLAALAPFGIVATLTCFYFYFGHFRLHSTVSSR